MPGELVEKNGAAILGVQAINLDEKRLPTGTFVDGRWGVASTLAQRFATGATALHVRCANASNAGVRRRRRRWGVAWENQSVVSWKGRVHGSEGLGATTSVPGSSTAASTNARNHATILLLNHPNAHVPPLM